MLAAISYKIPKDNELWELILILSEIVDLVMSPKQSESMLLYFEMIYKSFLECFCTLYARPSARPEIYFLIHLPTCEKMVLCEPSRQ